MLHLKKALAYLLINIYSLKVKEIRPVENPDSLDEGMKAARFKSGGGSSCADY